MGELHREERTVAPLKLHQLRSMLDRAIDDCIGLGVEVFGKKLGKKR